MHKALPVIQESADELQHLLRHERRPAKQQRRPALELLARGPARPRIGGATLLGVDRTTVGRWLAPAAQGAARAARGLRSRRHTPPWAADHRAHLQHALQQREGVAASHAVRPWMATPVGVALR
jgi:hypothetical protein